MYYVLDVERDLHGVRPPEGQFAKFASDGRLVATKQSRDLARTEGASQRG
jgi:hypothetical protein